MSKTYIENYQNISLTHYQYNDFLATYRTRVFGVQLNIADTKCTKIILNELSKEHIKKSE